MIFAQPHVSILQQSYLQLGHGPLLPTLTVVPLPLGPQHLARRRLDIGGGGGMCVGLRFEVFQQLRSLENDELSGRHRHTRLLRVAGRVLEQSGGLGSLRGGVRDLGIRLQRPVNSGKLKKSSCVGQIPWELSKWTCLSLVLSLSVLGNRDLGDK